MPQVRFTFVDLFGGIGGFHAALAAMGGKCVAAVEIDERAAAVYQRNWNLNPIGDITELANENGVAIPKHDVLCAGFPCQPFSKSGEQRGMDETRGTLYWNILRIVEECKPRIILLENVRNLAGPRHKHEWQIIVETLRDEGYEVSETPAIFSPHLLPPHLGGRPQVRERVFITATLRPVDCEPKFDCGPVATNTPIDGWDPMDWNIEADLPLQDDVDAVGCDLSTQETLWIEAWNDFVERMRKERDGRRLPGFPLWADEWVLRDEIDKERLACEPKWKVDFLIKNSEFYTEHAQIIDAWAEKWGVYSEAFPASRRKLEWQAQDTPRLWDAVLHFRPSGIRAKKPNYLPALVAIVQTSIIGPRKRRLSTREAARLQGLPDWFDFGDQPDSATYRQLGNGVSVGAVWHILREHAKRDEAILKVVSPELLAAILESPQNPDQILEEMH